MAEWGSRDPFPSGDRFHPSRWTSQLYSMDGSSTFTLPDPDTIDILGSHLKNKNYYMYKARVEKVH